MTRPLVPRIWLCAVALLVLLDQPVLAQAGMPTVLLSDLARMRFQTISFFLVVLLASAWIIRGIWNSLAREFPALPRLNYRRALGLVVLWGLLFVLVLTMISGAREILTPGAWKKQGFTYTLNDAPAGRVEGSGGKAEGATRTGDQEDNDPARREALDRLRVVLWKYALTHEGRFPPITAVPEIPEQAWRIADPSGLHFVYRSGLKADEGAVPLAYEPGLFGPDRWVLLSDGTLKKLPISDIRSMIPGTDPAAGPKPEASAPAEHPK